MEALDPLDELARKRVRGSLQKSPRALVQSDLRSAPQSCQTRDSHGKVCFVPQDFKWRSSVESSNYVK